MGDFRYPRMWFFTPKALSYRHTDDVFIIRIQWKIEIVLEMWQFAGCIAERQADSKRIWNTFRTFGGKTLVWIQTITRSGFIVFGTDSRLMCVPEVETPSRRDESTSVLCFIKELKSQIDSDYINTLPKPIKKIPIC